jgi:hypothetical protein
LPHNVLGATFGNMARDARGMLRVVAAEEPVMVERQDVLVMFKRVADEQTAIARGMAELEDVIGSLRGRKFYGAFAESGEYRVCVGFREGDDAGAPSGWRWARFRVAAMLACGFRATHPVSTP